MQFGSSVLSWSNHLIKRVMCKAEQNGIDIFDQDTDSCSDSCHVMENDVPKISNLFKFKYHENLIGQNIGQFHNDFDKLESVIGNIHSRK